VASFLLSSTFFKVFNWFSGEMHIDLLSGKTQHRYSILRAKSYVSVSFQLCGFCLHKWVDCYQRIWIVSSEDFNPLFLHRAKIIEQQCDSRDYYAG